MSASLINREAIFTKLFTTITQAAETVTKFKTKSRRVRLFNDVPAEKQPAIFQAEHAESYPPVGRGLPRIHDLKASIFIYFRSSDVSPGVTIQNALLDAIDQAMVPDNLQDNTLTLGGLVSHCWIEGDILKEPGDLDNQGLLLIPISIRVP